MELVSYDTVGPVVLAPIGDIQYFGRRSAIAWDHLKRHIDQAMARKAWFIGMGDYIDFLSPSNRKRLAQADLYDNSLDVVDDKARELTFQLYEQLLKPTTGRWLGLLEGHHFAQLQTGQTTDQYLCELLKTRFLGTCAYVRLSMQPSPKATSHSNYLIWAHHGRGGGAKAHAPLMKLENLTPYWEAHLFLIGHMTKVAAAPINRVRPAFGPTHAQLRHERIYLVGTGGWMKGYEEQSKQGLIPRGSYVESGMLAPVALGAPIITVTPMNQAVESRGEARAAHRNPGGGRLRQVTLETTVEV
jgi:hypothetical protein